MSAVDLEFAAVSKSYRIWHQDPDPNERSGMAGRLRPARGHFEHFWAVRDVTFQVHRGEAVGIIGHNGAGKSTILKLLSNITTPTPVKSPSRAAFRR